MQELSGNSEIWSGISARLVSPEANLLAGTATKVNSGTYHAVLLVPFEVSYISRDPKTGEFGHLGGILPEAQPIPEVQVEAQNVNLTQQGTLTVDLEINVRDLLSEISQTNRLNSLTIYVNEEPYETVNNLASFVQGGTVPVWQPHQSAVTLNKTVTLENVPPGMVTIRVQTAENAAGNVGWGGVALTLAKHETQITNAAPGRAVAFTISGAFSEDDPDQVTLAVDGQAAGTLTETGDNTNVFKGTVATSTGNQTATLWLETAPPEGQVQLGQMRATLDLSNEAERIIGLWQGAGGAYTLQTVYQWDESSRSTLYVADATPLHSSPEDDLQPFVVRITVPEGIADQMLEPGSWLKLKLFDQDVTLVESADFIPGDSAPARMKHLYIDSNNQPRLHALVSELAGTLAPQEVFSEEEFRLELITSGNDETVFDASAGVELQLVPAQQPFAAIMASTGEEGGTGNYTKEEVLTWFQFLFGKYGEELLDAYPGTITVEPLSHILPWHWKRYRVENWMQTDQNEGRALIIRIDDDQKSAVHAAQALFHAFQDCRSWLTRYDFNVAIMNGAFDRAVAGNTEGTDIYTTYHQGVYTPIAQALGDCALAGEIGLSITNAPAGFVFLANDVAEHAQAGEYKQAAVATTLGIVLTGPVMKLAKRTGKNIIIESLEGTFEISGALRNALIDVSEATNRAQKMEKLRPLIASGELSREFITWAFNNTKLLTENCGRLAVALGTRPKGKVAHHYLPVHPSAGLELKFLQAGLDPNAAEFGVWLDEAFHKAIHKGTARWGLGGAWNRQWIRFFADTPNTSEAQIRAFLDDLKDAISDQSIPVDQMPWPYP